MSKLKTIRHASHCEELVSTGDVLELKREHDNKFIKG
jgi:hypothetical protein